MAAAGRGAQPWPEEQVNRQHGLYSLHRMFQIVGAQLTHRDVRVLSFLFVDVIDDYARGLIRSGRDFFLALERQGRCDESNFRQVLQLLRIVTRHDLLPYVTLGCRKTVSPDPVDKYLEDTSLTYVMPRKLTATGSPEYDKTGEARDTPHRLLYSAPPTAQALRPRLYRGRTLGSVRAKRQKSAHLGLQGETDL
uniref:death effector domain-containing protein-like n=1 Tax=Pristiophorus japonicus TaxID=55135 RepID=UPI00398F8A22